VPIPTQVFPSAIVGLPKRMRDNTNNKRARFRKEMDDLTAAGICSRKEAIFESTLQEANANANIDWAIVKPKLTKQEMFAFT
jgi:hypothetical protein